MTMTKPLTDIVERLRERANMVTPWACCCGEAADEIERLQAFKKILEEEVERLHKNYAAEMERLDAEIERLHIKIKWLYDQLAAQNPEL